MDNLRAFEDAVDAELAHEEEPAIEAPPEIGADERRMHVRAYNYWVSLLDGRPFPSIHNLNPEALDDFGPHSVLLDFSRGGEDPSVPFIGRALREECGIDGKIERVSDVPSRSLLSRLTDHYLQIIANRAPIGFEAEFVSQRGNNTLYRGILMPLSSNGERIDFIYGVINWKEVADIHMTASLVGEVRRAAAAAPLAETGPVWADGPNSAPLDDPAFAAFGLAGCGGQDGDEPDFAFPPEANAGLADRLHAARASAETLKGADARTRAALYRALGQAYDFALAAEADPDGYAALLHAAGIKTQARAPMTPVTKLVFGLDYDKTRLTEFASALSHARREAVPCGGFAAFLDSFPGGLKAVVQAERAARRPEPKPDRVEARRASLRDAAPLAYVDVPAQEGEFVLFLARRQEDGRLALLAPVAAERSLLDKAVSRAVL